jgi:pimeloyl-ACP methyl ester carboxylesterase
MEADEQEQKRGWGRRLLFLGAVAGALGGAAMLRRRRQQPAAEAGSREIGGPVVGDVEFLEDERSVFSAYKSVSINGWDTRIIDQGQGEAIFFVPIIGGLEVVYSKQLREFANTNRVLFYERNESLDKPVYVEERVDELRRVMDHCGVEKAHIVGLGDAGVPTFNFGRILPDRALSLTSLCLGPRYRVPPYWLNEGVINPLTERLPIEGLIPNAVIKAMIIKGTYGNGRLPAHLIGHMVDHIPEQMRVHKFSVLPVTHHHEMRDWAHSLRTPTLLINRDDDPLAPVEEMEELAAALPNCYGLKVFRDGGRFITYTWADEVNKLLREFFATVEAGKPAPKAVRTEVMPL